MTGTALGTFGAFECRLVSDGSLPPLALADLFPSVSERELREADADGAYDVFVPPMNCLLIRGSALTALVDTGIGVLSGGADGTTGRLSESLRSADVAPGDVDLVVLTHCHPDHIGGLTIDGRPVFASARHVVCRAEWEFWTSEESLSSMPEMMGAFARAHLPPLSSAALVDLVDGETELAPGCHLLPAPGHTPGHCVLEIMDGERSLLYAGDALLHELSFGHAGWAAHVDHAPELAAETRRALLERAADRGSVMAAFHLDRAGEVMRLDGTYRLA